jgi:hypothetical protein
MATTVGRAMLATGVGSAGGIAVWIRFMVGEAHEWQFYLLFAAGVLAAAALGMSRQPLLGASLAALLSPLPLVFFEFPFLSVLPALIVAGGGMLMWVGTQPLRRGLTTPVQRGPLL